MGSGGEGCRTDTPGLKQHQLCNSDPPSIDSGHMTLERQGQLSAQVIKSRQKQILSLSGMQHDCASGHRRQALGTELHCPEVEPFILNFSIQT